MKKKIAFFGFLIPALGMLGSGLNYLTATEIMPYHVEGMGLTSWGELSASAQVMTLNFMKSAAVGFVTYGIAMFFLLLIPFRKGERWTIWAMLSLSLWQIGMLTYRTYMVNTYTPANPPLTPLMILLGIALLSFLLIITDSKFKLEKPKT